MVADSSVLLDGRRPRRRTIRTHRAYAHVECVPTSVLCRHPTRHWRTSSTVLDSSPCGDHHFCHSLARPDVEGSRGSPPAAHRTGLVCRHAHLEWFVLHSRDARVSEGADCFPSICRAVSESRSLDLLELVQRTSRYSLISVLSVSSLLTQQICLKAPPTHRAPLWRANHESASWPSGRRCLTATPRCSGFPRAGVAGARARWCGGTYSASAGRRVLVGKTERAHSGSCMTQDRRRTSRALPQ